MNTDIAEQPQALPSIIGLQKQEKQIIQSLKQDTMIMLIGFPGVGKTLLIKNMAKKYSSQTMDWQYLHASQIVVKGQNGVEEVNSILNKIEDKIVVFVIDELDVLADFRKGFCEELPHILAQKNTLKKKIVLVALTNRPQKFGKQCLIYFKKRIWFQLPEMETRSQILKSLTNSAQFQLNKEAIIKLASLTEKFTPCDLFTLVRTASYSQIKKVIAAKSFRKVGAKYAPCQDDSGEVKSYSELKSEDFLLDKIDEQELMKAFNQTKSSFQQEKYQKMLAFANL